MRAKGTWRRALLAVAVLWVPTVVTHQADAAPPPPRPFIHGGSLADWSPDGSRIAYQKEDDLFIARADGSHRRRVLVSARNPSWSPDGTSIAVSRNGNLWTFRPRDAEATRLTRRQPGQYFRNPSWSPDGSRISYELTTTPNPADHKIGVMNADGSSPHLITSFPPGEDAIVPEWSPDGAVIAFSVRYVDSDGLWRADLYTVTPDGVEVMRHTTGRLWFDVTWAPDGEEIAFTSCLGQAFAGCSVQTAGADGSEPVEVTPPDLGDARQPSWSPNGRALLVLGGGPWPAGPIGLYKLRLPRP